MDRPASASWRLWKRLFDSLKWTKAVAVPRIARFEEHHIAAANFYELSVYVLR